jgi:predicted RNase H-like HicB family nuclease
MNKEITFIVHEAEEGGYHAESVGVAIFAEGDTVQELKDNIKSGIECYYTEPAEQPLFAHLHFVKDEVFAL